MRNLLYVVAGLLIAMWAIIFLSFNASAFVHLLLLLALVFIIIRIFSKERISNK